MNCHSIRKLHAFISPSQREELLRFQVRIVLRIVALRSSEEIWQIED